MTAAGESLLMPILRQKGVTLLVLFLIFSFAAHSTTYYISTSGSDSYSGTSTTNPWKTISKVNAKNFKGDTILFKGGSTFYGSLYFTSADIGTTTKPIVIGSYGTGKATINSDTLYGVYIYNAAGFVIKNLIFNGGDRATNTKAGIIVYLDKDSTSLSFLKIDSVEVFGYRNAGISIGSWDTASRINNISITHSICHDNGSAGISIFGIQPYLHRNVYIGYNKVYNNSGIAEATSNSGSGIVLGSADVATIEYCTSYNNGWLHTTTTTGGPAGIWTYNSDSVTIQKNESHHNKTGTTKDGSGFDIDGGCTNSIMQYNYSHDNYGGGLVLAQASGAPTMKNITVRYNISENDGRKNDYAGIHLWSSGSNGGIQTVNIYNNTVYMTPISGAYPKAFFIRSGGISGVKVRNNIFQTTGGVELVRVPYTSTCTLQGNSYWSSGSTFKIIWGSTTYSSLNAWRTATGQEYVNGTASGLQADAQFADTTTGVVFSSATQITNLKRYKLKSTSSLLNKGLNLKSLFGTNIGTWDFWGNSLVNKSSFNIGAFQGTPITQSATINDANVIVGTSLDEQNAQNSLNVVSALGQHGVVIQFTVARQQKVAVDLYTIQGQFVKNIFIGEVNTGEYKQLKMDTDLLSNGVYILNVHSNSITMSKKFLLNK